MTFKNPPQPILKCMILKIYASQVTSWEHKIFTPYYNDQFIIEWHYDTAKNIHGRILEQNGKSAVNVAVLPNTQNTVH